MELFPLNSRRKTTVRVIPRFPARVAEGAGIDITRANGTFTFQLDFASLTPVAELASDDLLAVARSDGTFAQISADDLRLDGEQVRILVMDQATYDGLTPDSETLYFVTA